VLADREKMLQGQWPDKSCGYCRNIEEKGGISDRLRQIDIPDLYPEELDSDPTAVHVYPTVVEVFFNNTCNLSCLYCHGGLSSAINQENRKFGRFEKRGILLEEVKNQSRDLSPSFWQWFPEGFPRLRRLGVLGGEPLYQKETDTLLEMIARYPNPRCELNIVTNLSADIDRVKNLIERLKDLVLAKKLGRIDITCSLDCWGPQQEFVRSGLDLKQWEANFEYLLTNKWLYININSTITALTIKTMPELLAKINHWSLTKKIHYHFSGPTPGPSYFDAGILGGEEFKEDFEKILAIMPTESEEDLITKGYMQGIMNRIQKSQINIAEITKLMTYLDEKDRRRGTDWRSLFPWLTKYEAYVV